MRFLNFIPLMLTAATIIWVCWLFGIAHYRKDWDTEINVKDSSLTVKLYIWHNGFIISYSDASHIQKTAIDSVKASMNEEADRMIAIYKSLK